MRKMSKAWIILAVFLVGFFGIHLHGEGDGASSSRKTSHQIPKVTARIKVDGLLDEKVWQRALALELNFEVQPGKNIKPPVRTKVMLAYTSSHLYAAFKAFDPDPGKIRAHLTDRDRIWNDDYVGIVLDTFNDGRRSFNFYCNPYGIQADLILTLLGGENQAWDAIWNSAGKIDDQGYVVEMAIPFSSLRFQRKIGEQVWGVDAVRIYPRSLVHQIGLFPIDRNNNCYMCQADKVSGFKGARPGKNIEFDPTLSAILTQERESFPDGDFVDRSKRIEPGLTAHWGFTPNLTLTAAVQPDFSHVEADAAQLDINTKFALYYPEKRPFFLEGQTLFYTRLYAVYTRTLADPDWGIKLTGKEGANAIGLFSVQDNITNLLFPGSQGSFSTSLDMHSIGSVLRYRRDVGRSSNLGFLITDREGEDYYNRTISVDGDFRVSKRNRVLFQFLGSQTRYPQQVALDFGQPLDNFSGAAFDIFYHYRTEHFEFSSNYLNVSPNFRADLGFVPQTGIKRITIFGGYVWRRDPGHWYTMLDCSGMFRYQEDYNGNLLYRYYRFLFYYAGLLQSTLTLDFNIGKTSYMGIEFEDTYLSFNASMKPSGALSLVFNGAVGDQVDYHNVRAGNILMLNPVIQYNLGRHLSFSLDHLYERLDVDGGRLYTANLSNLRMVYQFSPRAFLRAILQYAHYEYNPDLYLFNVDPKFKHFFSQVLFSYKINPQTVLFIGYSDDYYGDHLIPLTQSNRTLFIKIGYALVL